MNMKNGNGQFANLGQTDLKRELDIVGKILFQADYSQSTSKVDVPLTNFETKHLRLPPEQILAIVVGVSSKLKRLNIISDFAVDLNKNLIYDLEGKLDKLLGYKSLIDKRILYLENRNSLAPKKFEGKFLSVIPKGGKYRIHRRMAKLFGNKESVEAYLLARCVQPTIGTKKLRSKDYKVQHAKYDIRIRNSIRILNRYLVPTGYKVGFSGGFGKLQENKLH